MQDRSSSSRSQQIARRGAPLAARSLPLLYLNAHGMDAAQRRAATQRLANPADHVLIFELSLPPVGLATFRATAAVSCAVAVVLCTALPQSHSA